jgi:hypothetical protein
MHKKSVPEISLYLNYLIRLFAWDVIRTTIYISFCALSLRLMKTFNWWICFSNSSINKAWLHYLISTVCLMVYCCHIKQSLSLCLITTPRRKNGREVHLYAFVTAEVWSSFTIGSFTTFCNFVFTVLRFLTTVLKAEYFLNTFPLKSAN